MVFSLALVLALILGVASAALSATGGNFILGEANEATTLSRLTATIAGPALTLVNQGTDAAATALNLNVASGKAPLRVNAAAGTATNLSADELDGKDSCGGSRKPSTTAAAALTGSTPKSARSCPYPGSSNRYEIPRMPRGSRSRTGKALEAIDCSTVLALEEEEPF